MKIADDVSFRKVRRKVSSDGFLPSVSNGAELIARKKVLYPFIRRYVDCDRLSIVSAKDAVEDNHIVDYGTDSNTQKRSEEFYVANTGEGYVLSTTGVGMTPEGEFIAETISPPESRNHKLSVVLSRHAFFDGPLFASSLVRKKIEQIGRAVPTIETACSLIPRYTNYYHWTVETLPKIRAVREYEKQTREHVTFLIPQNPPGWIKESLALVGVDDEETRHAESDLYRVSNLVVPTFPKPTWEDCRWVRETVLQQAKRKDIDVPWGSNVYISRKDARERRVLNEDAVVNTLEDYGFESYRLADQGVAGQALLFYEADAVVGAHGAGLSNLVYSNSIEVLELFGSKIKSNYDRLAQSAGLTYDCLECRPRGVDLEVDTTRLSTAIENSQ